MRHGRAKAARKTLQFFERTQGIRPPFHVLLDGTFIVAVVKHKVDLVERLTRVLHCRSTHCHVAQSSLDELQRLQRHASQQEQKDLLQQALVWAKRNCSIVVNEHKNDGDEQMALGGAAEQDIYSLATTTDAKYFVASQDDALLDALRATGSVPIIRLARGCVLLLEQPSKAATLKAKQEERSKWNAVSQSEQELAHTVRQHEQQQQQQQKVAQQQVQRQKRKAKAPNPLSCKKPKTLPTADGGSTKRNRRRKRNNTTAAGASDS